MISMLDLLVCKKRFSNLYKEMKKQDAILLDGLGQYKKILMFILPSIFTILFLSLSLFIDLSIKKVLANIITIMPSLIGFLIASATIIISLNNEKLNAKADDVNYTYKEVGGSIFFYATKLSFILLLIAFMTPEHFPVILNDVKVYILFIAQTVIYWLFSKFIIMVLYGLIYLTSSMEVEEDNN